MEGAVLYVPFDRVQRAMHEDGADLFAAQGRHHVVQQVGDADHEQYRVDCSGLREAPQACVRGFCKRLHCCGLWFFEYPRDRLPGIPHVPGKDVSE